MYNNSIRVSFFFFFFFFFFFWKNAFWKIIILISFNIITSQTESYFFVSLHFKNQISYGNVSTLYLHYCPTCQYGVLLCKMVVCSIVSLNEYTSCCRERTISCYSSVRSLCLTCNKIWLIDRKMQNVASDQGLHWLHIVRPLFSRNI